MAAFISGFCFFFAKKNKNRLASEAFIFASNHSISIIQKHKIMKVTIVGASHLKNSTKIHQIFCALFLVLAFQCFLVGNQ